MQILDKFKKWPVWGKTGVAVIIALVAFFGWQRFVGGGATRPQYQMAKVEKETLVTSVTASGNITSSGSVAINTNASGTISQIYVKNGDAVFQGQKIADITPDQTTAQKQAAAWNSYLSAQNTLAAAQANLYTLQNTLFVANQKFMNDAVAASRPTNDPVYVEENATWLAAEANYKNQQAVISQTRVAVSSAWLSYQLVAPSITAPATGIVENLAVVPGTVISAQNANASTGTTTPTFLGNINLPQTGTQASVSLSEIDAPKVSAGQKVTLTMDAFPDKSFTGKVLVVNTNGVVSSGVTTYPAVISFDSDVSQAYPNMAVTAKVITDVKTDVLLVPSAAVQTNNGQSTVRVLVNGQMQEVPVETGASNTTQTEITSGISEGETVVTGMTSGNRSASNNTSPFGVFGGGRGGFGGGGGAIRINGR